MLRSDATARDPRVTFDYSCPETDRTVTATVPLKDVYPDRSDCDGYYDPPTYADVAECPACGGPACRFHNLRRSPWDASCT